MPIVQLSPQALQEWLADGARQAPILLDVRENWESQICTIEGSKTIPMGTIPAALEKLDSNADTVVICHHGGRSMQVALFLERNGFSKLYNLAGGVDAWARQIDPTMAVY